ncbi:Sec-independent protein translocase subunit TatA/TatB [Deinococcus navajonensis]|uniref:Sec-independent protein translocase protein TatA n=1 Tax=Deinococcus navajonensis TaxID=309884 RepID=A0ABV8XKU8_9DEIO
MPNIGAGELLIILLVALMVFGPRKLPELGKSLGAGLREFRKSTQGLKEELEGSLREPAPGPAPVQTIHATVDPRAVTPVVPAQAVIPQPAGPSAPGPSAVSTQSVTPDQVIPAQGNDRTS